jgi:hypothetical protein
MDRDVLPQESRGSRWRRALLAAAAVLVIYTLLGFFLVPRIIRSQIVTGARESLGREAQVQDVRFNPFTLAATVHGAKRIRRVWRRS